MRLAPCLAFGAANIQAEGYVVLNFGAGRPKPSAMRRNVAIRSVVSASGSQVGSGARVTAWDAGMIRAWRPGAGGRVYA